jgi:hypothetical protein
MAKYQDNEDKMTEDYSRAKIEAEKAKEKLERVTLVCSIQYIYTVYRSLDDSYNVRKHIFLLKIAHGKKKKFP